MLITSIGWPQIDCKTIQPKEIESWNLFSKQTTLCLNIRMCHPELLHAWKRLLCLFHPFPALELTVRHKQSALCAYKSVIPVHKVLRLDITHTQRTLHQAFSVYLTCKLYLFKCVVGYITTLKFLTILYVIRGFNHKCPPDKNHNYDSWAISHKSIMLVWLCSVIPTLAHYSHYFHYSHYSHSGSVYTKVCETIPQEDTVMMSPSWRPATAICFGCASTGGVRGWGT